MRKILILFTIILCFCVRLEAFEQPFSFDTPRVAALGGAYIALSDDASAIFHNPAGLALFNNENGTMEFGGIFNRYSWNADTLTQWHNWKEYGGYFTFWQNYGVFGASFNEIGDNSKTVWLPDSTGKLTPIMKETIVTLTSSESLSDFFSTGIKATYVNLKSDYWDGALTNNHIGILETGLLYNPNSSLKLGIILKNLMTTDSHYLLFDDFGNYQKIKELPKDIDLGFSVQLSPYAILLVDCRNLLERKLEYAKNWDAPNITLKRSYHIGMEMWFSSQIALRGGFYQKKVIVDFNELDDSGNFIYSNKSNFSLGGAVKIGSGEANLSAVFDDHNNRVKDATYKFSGSFGWSF